MSYEVLTVIASIGGSSAVSGFILFQLQERTKADFARQLQNEKANLDRQNANELELLRGQLAIANTLHAARFSKVFEKTAEILAETYRRLVEIEKVVNDYTNTVGPENQDLRITLAHKLDELEADFKTYFFPNEIYLERQTADKIKGLVHTLFHSASTSDMLTSMHQSRNTPEQAIQRLEDRETQLRFRIAELRGDLQSEFRRVLGFSLPPLSTPETKPSV
jgi:hypothetical protein